MRKVVSAGGIIFANGRMLVIKHPKGYGFPKGHVEPGETLEQAAFREVQEETGLRAEVIQYVGKVNRLSTENSGERVEKDIELFLMRVTGESDTKPEELFEWVPIDQVLDGMWHAEERVFLKANLLALVDIAAHEYHKADS